ncbi:MAG TPA: TetR/AcrR family transcriptional regulator [Acidimicrobiia bacterium]
MPVRKSVLSGDELRLALLDAASALLHEEGPHAVSTRRLADLVGTSTQSIYTLFGGKQGLLRAVYREGFDRLGQHIRAVPVTHDVRVDLRGLGDAYRASAKASPHLYSVMFERPVAEFECSDEDLEHALLTLYALADGVQRAIDAGVLHGAEAFDIAVNLWVAAHGFVSLELSGHLFDEPDALEARYEAVLGHALAPYAVSASASSVAR